VLRVIIVVLLCLGPRQFIRWANAYKGRDKAGPGGYKERPALRGLEQFMRIFGVAMLAASLFVTGSLAGSAGAEPLRPGYPAGVLAARGNGGNTAIMLGTGAVILAGVGILASGDSSVVNSLQINSEGVTVPPTVVTVVSTSTTGTP
jgi:hypothetical protein